MDIASFLYSNKGINEILRKMMIGMRLYYPYNIIYMRKMRKMSPPPNSLERARKFYADNLERVERITEFLSDEKSKDVYNKVIRLRQFYEKKDIPEYNYVDQYFPLDLPEFSEKWGGGEVFVDCGAFNGDIDVTFAKRVKNYLKIIAFEPDRSNIKELKKRDIARLEIIEAACFNYEGVLRFNEQEKSGGSHIADKIDEGTVEVACTTIDNTLNGNRCDFIKMDIEGAEWEALHGAKDTIQRYHPKLAISIYHRDDDMVRIPEYIHELVPEYNIYIRAHTMGIAEVICYAIMP